MTASADPTDHEHAIAPVGFVVARTPRNGALPREYLRGFQVVGRNGLARLAFGARAAAQVFDHRPEADDIARRLRRRTALADYDYRVEEVTREAPGVDAPGSCSSRPVWPGNR